MKKLVAAIISVTCISTAFSQTPVLDSSAPKHSNFSVSGYIEPYYVYDFNRPQNNTRPGFMYSHNRAGEATVNLAFLKGSYSTENVRANLSLAAGTYMNANLAAEPGVLKNIFEANAGVKISKKSELWIDAGIMPSHIGFESAVGKDNWTLTRSMVADNTPYYEAGAKLSYTSKNTKWYLAAMYLNGWQRIQRIDGNTTPAFGTQITYKPTSKITLNYSTFIGNDKPDTARLMRYYHNVYGIFQVSDKLAITAGFDYGMEQKNKGKSDLNNWYTPILIFRIAPDAKNAIALRGEYFNDENGILIYSGTANGFKTFGASINYDRSITPNVMWRIEARTLNSKDALFIKRNAAETKNNTFISTAFTVGF